MAQDAPLIKQEGKQKPKEGEF